MKETIVQSAVCRCEAWVISQVPEAGHHGGSHVAQGVNCFQCGALHIFATDVGHSETFFRDIGLLDFYKMVDALVDAGLAPLFPGVKKQ